jgi:hypothetical protein
MRYDRLQRPIGNERVGGRLVTDPLSLPIACWFQNTPNICDAICPVAAVILANFTAHRNTARLLLDIL